MNPKKTFTLIEDAGAEKKKTKPPRAPPAAGSKVVPKKETHLADASGKEKLLCQAPKPNSHTAERISFPTRETSVTEAKPIAHGNGRGEDEKKFNPREKQLQNSSRKPTGAEAQGEGIEVVKKPPAGKGSKIYSRNFNLQ